MATVRKRTLPSGKVVWQADYRDGSGARRSKQFTLKKEADGFLVKARGEVARGVHVADSASITIKEAAAIWLKRGDADGLEASTLAAYEQHVRLHIVPLIGARKLSTLSAPAIEAFKDELLQTRSRAMVKRVLTSLSGIISEAQRVGLAAHNPMTAVRVKISKRDAERPEMPTKPELQAMLRGVSEKWKPLIWTSIFTGLRGSELRGLTWEHVDLDSGAVKVRQRASLSNKIGPPKSAAGNRDVPLSPALVDVLKAWKKVCPKGELNLVFPNGKGNVEYHQNILNRCFFPLQLSLGISTKTDDLDEDGQPIMAAKYGLHALRHAAAALFIEQRMSPKKIQTLMGHSSIQVTYDLYGYLFDAIDADRADVSAIADRLISA